MLSKWGLKSVYTTRAWNGLFHPVVLWWGRAESLGSLFFLLSKHQSEHHKTVTIMFCTNWCLISGISGEAKEWTKGKPESAFYTCSGVPLWQGSAGKLVLSLPVPVQWGEDFCLLGCRLGLFASTATFTWLVLSMLTHIEHAQIHCWSQLPSVCPPGPGSSLPSSYPNPS